MLGDIILELKRLWKENTCMHDYHTAKEPTHEQCSKCGRVR